MNLKPRLSFWQIWNMSFGFLGIQFGFALQNANVSRIFETLGAKIEDIPILWIAAPVTGLILQPIIGYYSDRTWGKWGRRRPFFFAGAILASLALFILPNSVFLWMAAGMLWIMDASINISMEPFRAFVGDMLPEEQRTQGFATQSFFIGLGAVVASALPYLLTNFFSVPNTAGIGEIPQSVKYSFYLGAVVLFGAVFWTVFRTKEYPPDVLKSFQEKQLIKTNVFTNQIRPKGSRKLVYGTIFSFFGIGLFLLFYLKQFNKELNIFSIGLFVLGVLYFVAYLLEKNENNTSGLVQILNDLSNMPSTMKQLAVVQFFSWFALFAMWIYMTNAVTAHIYGTNDPTSVLYNKGADWVGVCFAAYNGFAAIVAFFLPVIAKWTNRKTTHMISLVIGGISLISVYFISNPNMLLVSMLGIGLAWASILSMPYAILTGSIPQEKMGLYMGIFNFFIVIPQIFAASLLGFLTKSIFNGNAVYTLILGGCCMIIGAVVVVFVKD